MNTWKMTVAIWTAGGVALLVGMTALASAETTSLHHDGIAMPSTATDLSAQSRKRHRGPTRLRVYPAYSYPGPNAVRQCEVRYEQEFRQSGTVIVPRMHCWWQRG